MYKVLRNVFFVFMGFEKHFHQKFIRNVMWCDHHVKSNNIFP